MSSRKVPTQSILLVLNFHPRFPCCNNTTSVRFAQRLSNSVQPQTKSHITIDSLQKHAYSNILKISPPKTEKLSDKNSDIFHISA